ncbi:MAG: BatD family protein [Gammaproteobacteria bacterium]|nr:BatD family protein [Gammaproteobacteria bacterium]
MVISARCVLIVIALILATTAIPTVVNGNPGLDVRVNNPQVELGKPFTLTLRFNQRHPSLDAIDLTPWRQAFHVMPITDIEKRPHGQRWQVRLYPYALGSQPIPVLNFAGQHSQALVVDVTPAVDPKTHTPMEFRTAINPPRPWLKQAVYINAELISTSPIMVVETNTPTTASGVVYPQRVTHETLSAGRTRHHSGWIWFPQQRGTQTLEPLFVVVQRDGVMTHSFYIRPPRIEVQPLPPYLPATLPVGNLQLHATTTSPRWRFTDRLYSLGFELLATDVLPSDLPPLDRQLHSRNALTLYTATQRLITRFDRPMTSTTHYQIPFSLAHSGYYSPGSVQLQYFDPHTAKLRSLVTPLPAYIAIAPVWAAMTILLLVWFLAWAGAGLMRTAADALRQRWGYRRLLQHVNTLTSVVELRDVLRQIAVIEAWPPNLSLSAWAQQWQTRHRPIALNPRLVVELSQALYQGKSIDIDQQRQMLRGLCYRRFPLLRWTTTSRPLKT